MTDSLTTANAPRLAPIEKAGRMFALLALVVYIGSGIVLGYSTFLATNPALTGNELPSLFEGIALALAGAAIVAKRPMRTPKQALLVAVAFSALVLSALRTGDYAFVHAFVLLVAVAGIDLRKLCVTYYAVVLPIVIVIMLTTLSGGLFNKDVIPNDYLVFSYGFIHPNKTGSLLLSALGAMTYACWDRPSWKAPALLAVAAAAFAHFTLSSHATTALLVALAAVNLVGHLPALSAFTHPSRRVFVVMLMAVPLVLTAVMLAVTALYDADNPLCTWFNTLIHSRPYFAHSYYELNVGFTPFGHQLHSSIGYHDGLPFFEVDCGYSFIAVSTGLFAGIMLFVVYAIAVRKLSDDNRHFFIMAMLLMNALYMLVETMPLYLPLNFAALFLSVAFVPPAPTVTEG